MVFKKWVTSLIRSRCLQLLSFLFPAEFIWLAIDQSHFRIARCTARPWRRETQLKLLLLVAG